MKKMNNGITNVVKPTKSNNKVNVKKCSGLMPRGNTVDNRYHNPSTGVIGSNVVQATAASSHAVASHSTTVGVSSQNGSRPGSAIKKKSTAASSGLSPHSKILQLNDKYHNLLYYKTKPNSKAQINIKQSNYNSQTSKGRAAGADSNAYSSIGGGGGGHKKTQSVAITKQYPMTGSRSKPKIVQNAQGHNPAMQSYLTDYNSAALEQILSQ